MAAPTLIKIQSATFKGKAITGATQASIEFGGSQQTARGDGAVAAQIAYVEDIKGTVSVTALAAQIKDTDHILPGNGALVIVGYTQAAGSGAVGGGSVTWTFPNATMGGTNRGVPQDGNPTIALNFVCVAATGLPTDIFSVA